MEDKILWAPWRIGYIQGLDKSGECFICRDIKNPQDDDRNLVLWRTKSSLVMLNRYPYNNGHLLVAPSRHIGGLDEAKDNELLELIKLTGQAQKALNLAIKPHGFNVGINLGKCGGAGLPEHLHIHVVPRWDGDTNFISTCGETRVISQSLAELLDLLKNVSKKNSLPGL